MTDELEGLRGRIREAKVKKGKRRIFTRPVIGDFAYGTALVFDQTLSKSGWSVLSHTPERGLQVTCGGLLRPNVDPGITGFEATFAKDRAMDLLIGSVFNSIEAQVKNGRPCPEAVVHEMPAVMGHRLESSLMAASTVRRQARNHGFPVRMISRQAAYSRIVGAPAALKVKGTEAANRYIPPEAREVVNWNQDVHDTVILGLTYLLEKAEVAQRVG